MDTQAETPSFLSNVIVEWLAEQALLDTEPAGLFGELCRRLRGLGTPIMRAQVAFRVLHPLYDAGILAWTAEKGVVVDFFRPDESGQENFQRGPLGYALTHRLPILRRRLAGEAALLDFSVLEEFRALGGTDYVVFLVGFDPAKVNGIICSWLGDRSTGFTDREIE
jgi:adenylate cyclase